MKKRICIVTGSRAEWGLFYPLANELKRDNRYFRLQIIATGAHLSSEFGLTYREIEKDGFKIDRKAKMPLLKDTEETIAKSVGIGIVKIAEALKSLKPNLVFLLGDRFEIFAAAAASFFLKTPIAHIHGGEITEGSMDDSLRHAITKMSQLHFTSTEDYRRRVIQMGEDPKNVFNVGALAIDNIKNQKWLKKGGFEKKINFKLGKRNVLITFNPATIHKKEILEKQLRLLLRIVRRLPETKIILTMPNIDIYSQSLARIINGFVLKNNNRAIAFKSLGRNLYLNALHFVDAVAGNSSSGIIEAPSIGIPTINIGDRQRGRIRARSIIDADANFIAISNAFKKALSDKFMQSCKKTKNPHGDGMAAKKILNIIKRLDYTGTSKRFYDLKLLRDKNEK